MLRRPDLKLKVVEAGDLRDLVGRGAEADDLRDECFARELRLHITKGTPRRLLQLRVRLLQGRAPRLVSARLIKRREFRKRRMKFVGVRRPEPRFKLCEPRPLVATGRRSTRRQTGAHE